MFLKRTRKPNREILPGEGRIREDQNRNALGPEFLRIIRRAGVRLKTTKNTDFSRISIGLETVRSTNVLVVSCSRRITATTKHFAKYRSRRTGSCTKGAAVSPPVILLAVFIGHAVSLYFARPRVILFYSFSRSFPIANNRIDEFS